MGDFLGGGVSPKDTMHMAYCCILRYDIRNLLLRSNCSNNKKSRFIINNDCNKDNKNNDNILNGEH